MDISKELQEAKGGFEIWKRINAKYDIQENGSVICFPTDNMELNDAVIRQFSDYKKKKYIDNLILIMRDPLSQTTYRLESDLHVELICLRQEEITAFVRFLRLVNVMKRVVVISDEEPFSNLNLVGKYNISIDSFVAGSFLWRIDVTN
ncbi:MAG: hypothetical protein ACI4E2_07270 [Acetatifactor sp.]